MKIRYFLLISLFFFNQIESKVLVFTYCYSNPEFIEMQNKTFDHFIQDDYEFIVFSDAPTEEGHKEILDVCRHSGVSCVRISSAYS